MSTAATSAAVIAATLAATNAATVADTNAAATAIEVPATLASAVIAELGAAALPRWGLEAIVAEGVREGLLTTGEAGELLGLGYSETEAFLKRKGVPAVFTDEDMEQDGAHLREMFPDLTPG